MSETRLLYDNESLSNLRDRFIRAEVMGDFEAHRDADSIALDNELFATPVADNRYTVIWRRAPDAADSAVVMAVVAAQYGGEDPQALRRKLQRAVESQFEGRLTLK